MTMTTRLDSTDSELQRLIEAANEDQRRAAVLFACELAFTPFASAEPLARSVLERISRGEPVPDSDRLALKEHEDELDARYWAKRDAFQSRNEGTLDGWRLAFNQYLAVSSISSAAEGLSAKAVGEAIYDATSTVADFKAARERIVALLR